MKTWMILIVKVEQGIHLLLILKKKLKEDIKTQLSIKYLPSPEEFLLTTKKIDYQ